MMWAAEWEKGGSWDGIIVVIQMISMYRKRFLSLYFILVPYYSIVLKWKLGRAAIEVHNVYSSKVEFW